MIQREGSETDPHRGNKRGGERNLEEEPFLDLLDSLAVGEEISVRWLEDPGEARDLVSVSEDHEVEQHINQSQTKVERLSKEEEERHHSHDHLQSTVDSKDVEEVRIPSPRTNISTEREGKDTEEGRDKNTK
jgi:hypothetical protein